MLDSLVVKIVDVSRTSCTSYLIMLYLFKIVENNDQGNFFNALSNFCTLTSVRFAAIIDRHSSVILLPVLNVWLHSGVYYSRKGGCTIYHRNHRRNPHRIANSGTIGTIHVEYCRLRFYETYSLNTLANSRPTRPTITKLTRDNKVTEFSVSVTEKYC